MSHRFDPTILREYDIRGIVGTTLFTADAHALGRVFAQMLTEAGGRRAAVGYDGRLTSPELEAALLDGLDKLIADGQPFHGFRAAARRFDCGDKLGYLETIVALGLEHPMLGAAFRRILATYL